MSKQANPTAIGAFVVGAIVLIIAGILIFTKVTLFSKQDKFVIYFPGTVNGLKVGAPVKLKGVQIGQVTEIRVELNLDQSVVRTPVIIEIDMSEVELQTDGDPEELSKLTYRSLIRHGLRAQLKSQSLLTGRLYVEINFYPDSVNEPQQYIAGDTEYKEIPSLPSETEEIISDVGTIISTLKKLPLKELFESLVVTAKSLEKMVNSPQTARNLEQIGEILSTMNRVVGKLNKQLDPVIGELKITAAETRALVQNVNQQVKPLTSATENTLAQAQRSLAALENVTGEDSPLYVDLSNTLVELSDAARSMRILADYLQRNPDAILFGKPVEEEQ